MTGEDLKEWREARRLTQTELSELLGVQLNTVSRWEVGTRAIPSFLELALKALDSKKRPKENK